MSAPEHLLVHRSANQRKWEFKNGLYQKHLELYLDRMYVCLTRSGAKTVLDAGCGEGFVYRAMRERGFCGEWCGFDFNEDAVTFAKQASPEAQWHHASAYNIPFADASFDLVFCSQVMEHLTEPHIPLMEYVRVSRKWILMSVPLEPYFRMLTGLSVHLHIGGDPGHVNFWNGAQLREFAQQAGQLQRWERTTVYQIALIEKATANTQVGGLQQHG